MKTADRDGNNTLESLAWLEPEDVDYYVFQSGPVALSDKPVSAPEAPPTAEDLLFSDAS